MCICVRCPAHLGHDMTSNFQSKWNPYPMLFNQCCHWRRQHDFCKCAARFAACRSFFSSIVYSRIYQGDLRLNLFSKWHSWVFVSCNVIISACISSANFHEFSRQFIVTLFLSIGNFGSKPSVAITYWTYPWRPSALNGVGRRRTYSSSQKWWPGCGLWSQFIWAVQDSPLGWRNFIHAGIGRRRSYSSSQKWWPGCSLWSTEWAVRDSPLGWRNFIRAGIGR